MDIIGAGFGRTGTSSIKKALEDLGFGPCYHMQEVIRHPSHVAFWRSASAQDPAAWLRLFRPYRASIDYPACIVYRELMALYPDAKVLLTIRDPQTWYESTLETIYRVSNLIPAWQRGLLWPVARFYAMANAVIWDGLFEGRFEEREFAIGKYLAHIEAVKAAVPPEKLLVFDVRQGWGPLCEFLGVPEPAHPFPHLNDRKMILWLLRWVRALTILAPIGAAGLVAALIYLLF